MSVFADNNNHSYSNGGANGKASESNFSLASIGLENLFSTAVQHNNNDMLHQNISTLLDSNVVPTRSMYQLMTKTILTGTDHMPVTTQSMMHRILTLSPADDSMGWRPATGKPEDWKSLLQMLEGIKVTSTMSDGPLLLLKEWLATLDQIEAHGREDEHQIHLILQSSGETHTSTVAKLFSIMSYLIEKTQSPVRDLGCRFLEHILLAFLHDRQLRDSVYSRFYELFNALRNNSFRLVILRTFKYPRVIHEVTTNILARNFDSGLFQEYTHTRGSSTRPLKRARTETSEVDTSFAPSASLLHRFALQDLLYRPYSKGRTSKASPLMLVALLYYLFLAVLKEEPKKSDLLKDDFLMSQLHENMTQLKTAIDAYTIKDSKEAVLQIHGYMTAMHDVIEYETRARYKNK